VQKIGIAGPDSGAEEAEGLIRLEALDRPHEPLPSEITSEIGRP
jgi:hypothetical protein